MVASFRKYASGLKIGATATTTTLNSDYPPGEPGRLIWVTGSGAFYRDNGTDWEPLADGTIALTGQPLNQNEVIVGNSTNHSAAVNTNSAGDVLATDSTGLTIKSGVIVNAQINAAAAIALTKLATLTANRALISNASGFIAPSSVTNVELGYVSGVTSSIQTQLDGKLTPLTGFANNGNTFGGTATLGTNDNFPLVFETNNITRATLTTGGILQLANLTASRAVVSDGSSGLTSSVTTLAELAFVSGVTSSIQTQLNARVTGPASATDNAIARFDTTTGKLIQNSTVTISDTGNIAAIAGTISAPSISFGTAATGLYSQDSHSLEYVAAGHSVVYFFDGTDSTEIDLRSTNSSPAVIATSGADSALTLGSVDGSNSILFDSDTNGNNIVFATNGNNRATLSGAGLLSLANLTASRVVVSDASSNLISSVTTLAELAFVSGVTSSIQTQLDGKLNLTGGTLTGALTLSGDPTTGLQAATKQYVDNVAQGLKPKAAAHVATTANITLSGTQTIDGVAVVAGDRVLVKDQTSSQNNGIYVVASGAWTRATDFDSLSPIDEINGAFLAVQLGTTNAGKIFVETSTVTSLGTSPIVFVFFNSSTSLIGGNGITISGNNISVNHDGNGLTFVSTQLALQLDGTTLSKSGTGLKVATGGITNTEVAVGAGITYSKLTLTGSIVNADVATGAAIALTKLATLTASRALVSDASGFITAATTTATEVGYLSGVTSSIQTQIDSKVTGPASATDNAIARFDTTTGKLIKNSGVTIDASNNIVTPGNVSTVNLAVSGVVSTTLALSANLSVAGTVNSNLIPGTTATYTLGASGAQWLEVWTNSIKSATSITTYAPVVSRGVSGTAVVEEAYIDATTLTGSTTAVLSAFTLATANYRGYAIDYVITQSTTSRVRTGHLNVVTNGTDVSITEDFNETGDAGISFTAAINGANVELTYTNASANASSMRADVKRFRA